MKLILGDCLLKLKELPDNSVDSVVTDPPYGLSFMGKKWDYDVPSTEVWKECLRVLKPGGFLLSFSGSRTYHRMAINIEDAGFEIRDQIMWVYGSGFPKSTNIGLSIDKKLGAQGNRSKQLNYGTAKVAWDAAGKECIQNSNTPQYEPKTDLAKKWDGWGTALKPAHEPIVVARKAPEGTCRDNVLKYGTGALNIGDCKVGERWPANFIHDGVDEVWARYFYCPKASKKDRNEGVELNHHPTVKPTDLMAYLCRLVTQPSGVVLDPYMGSGTTGKAAKLEGFEFIGIEREEAYHKIASDRINNTQPSLTAWMENS